MNHGPAYFFIIIVLIFLICIDLYVFQGVKTLTTGIQELRFRQILNMGYWIISVMILLSLLVAGSHMIENQVFTPYVKSAFNLFLILFLSKLTFIIVLFGEDLYRGGAALVNLMIHRGEDISFIPGRIKFISQAGMILAIVNLTLLSYGAIKGKHQYKIHKQVLYFSDLPDAFDGFTIAQLSDVHAGSFDDPDALQRGIDLVKEQKADLFVFTGDIVNNKADELIPFMGHFSQIKAPYGQFSVLGNHDYGEYVRWESKEAEEANLNKLINLHQQMDYRLLLNEHVIIEKDGQSITLIGVENWGIGFTMRGELEKSLIGVKKSAFKILLSHDPSHWDKEVKNHPMHIHLTLSGHTHGMQMGIETPWFRFSPVQFRYKNWAGLTSENDRYLYVNRGFGFIGYFGRIGIWPEVTVIELRKGKT